jgi:hypothetical protein
VCIPQAASSNPIPPPASPSRILSVSTWRMTRGRLAPSAIRMANSRLRADDLAIRRLATFTQTIRSTKPTAARSTSRNGRTLPTICSFKGRMLALMPWSASGKAVAKFLVTSAISARACAIVTPGLSRPIPWIPKPALRFISKGFVHWRIGA